MAKIRFEKADRENAVQEIQTYFQNERNEGIGNLAAEFFLDFILDQIGPVIYNQAINDAHTLLMDKAEELYALQKRR